MKFLFVIILSLTLFLFASCFSETDKKCKENQVLMNGSCVLKEQSAVVIPPTPTVAPTVTPTIKPIIKPTITPTPIPTPSATIVPTPTPIVVSSLNCGTIASGSFEVRTMYQQATLDEGNNCLSETQNRKCVNGQLGSWSGTYTQSKCVVSRVRYESSTVEAGGTCKTQTQVMTCEKGICGAWIPSNYINLNCSVLSNILTTTSITQYGITWTFKNAVQYGQFVNGDYYIIPPATLISISPHPTAEGDNGSQLNPVVNGYQGLDKDANLYKASFKVTLPLELKANDSLVSTISLDGTEKKDWSGGTVSSHAKIRAAAVLTVLAKHPPQGTFRPSYMDRSHTLYNISQVKRDLLPKLSYPSVISNKNGMSPVDFYARGLKRPWIIFTQDWNCRSLHPIENMKNYHREVGFFYGEATLFLLTNMANEELLINYIQVGIDYYHMAINGYGDSSFWAGPLVITGLLLNAPGIYNSFKENRIKSLSRDFEKFYYWPDRKSTLKSSIVPEGKTWSGYNVFFRKQVGKLEHEHLHPSEWIDSDDHFKNESYRHCCDSWPNVGMVLAGFILESKGHNIKEKWNHNATFDYIDRWMTEDHSPTGQQCIQLNKYKTVDCTSLRGGSAFVDTMWSLYR